MHVYEGTAIVIVMRREWWLISVAALLGCPDPGENEDSSSPGPCSEGADEGDFPFTTRGEVDTGEGGGAFPDLAPFVEPFAEEVIPTAPEWTYDAELRAFARPTTLNEEHSNEWAHGTTLLAFSNPPGWLDTPFSNFLLPVATSTADVPRNAHAPPVEFSGIVVELLEEIRPGTFSTTTARGTEVAHPAFFHYLGDDSSGSQASVVTGSLGQIVAEVTVEDGSSIRLRGPLTTRVELDIPTPAPDGAVFVYEPTVATAGQFRVFCENGFCDPSGDPDFDECVDGWDQDPDGRGDNCDWNCLPHLDFNDPGYPITEEKASDSRVEWGKGVALMGTGSFCFERQDTWETELAAKALDELSFLQTVRNAEDPDYEPDLPPVRPRIHHCWIFPDEESIDLCTRGIDMGDGTFGPRSCPAGLEDYPYGREEFQIDGVIDTLTTFAAAWRDVQRLRDVRGPEIEPVHMVQVMETDGGLGAAVQRCGNGAGVAASDPPSPALLGASINCGFDRTRNMAHEFGHLLGLQHDETDDPTGVCSGSGFMRANAGPCPWVADTFFNDFFYPNFPTFEAGTQSKWNGPRSSGYEFRGCQQDDDCRPWGGEATCEGTQCVP